MRSDLSKSLKLNSVESGCLGGESGEERRSGGGRIRGGEEERRGEDPARRGGAACSVDAGANAADRSRSSLTNHHA